MPTYDYECKSCHHKWEAFQSIKAPATKKCPECGKNTAQRMIGPGAGIIFKGSGFYITDYRSDSYKKSAEADSSSPAKSDSAKSDSAKSDSSKAESPKPAPKSSESKGKKKSE